MKTTIPSAATCLLFLVASTVSAQAGLIQLDESQFNAAAGGAAVVEDFEGFATDHYANPFTFANGRYVTSSNPVILNLSIYGPTNRLASETGHDFRTFDLFPTGTTLVGMDVSYINPDSDTFAVTVTGRSGVLSLPAQTGDSLGDFLGFHDPLGITSISFERMSGTGNYSFDNFQTAASAAVPEPSSLVLLCMGAAGLMTIRHRRKRRLDEPERRP